MSSFSMQLFEGLKAYYGEDGKVRLFRPDMNCKRLNKSAELACLPVSCCVPCMYVLMNVYLDVSVFVCVCVCVCVIFVVFIFPRC